MFILRRLHGPPHVLKNRRFHINVERVGEKESVGMLTFDRCSNDPIISTQFVKELLCGFRALEGNDSVRCTVFKGSGEIFLTGAAVEGTSLQLASSSASFVEQVSSSSKPTIAVVNGLASGIGCELAMACDIVYSSERAIFAMNQIRLGTIPGSGGTQRLRRAAGKSLAMEMILSGASISAAEARQAGLVSKMLPERRLQKTSIRLAEIIASKSRIIQEMAREAVKSAEETTLKEGLRMETRLFEATFATKDHREGMSAHLERRSPIFLDE